MKQFIKDMIPAFGLFGSFWVCHRICTIPSELWIGKTVHSFGIYVFFLIVLIFGFNIIPYEQIGWKILSLFILVTVLLATILYLGIHSYLIYNFTWEELCAQHKANRDIAIERIIPGTKRILNLWQPFLFTLLCIIQAKFRRLDIHKSESLNNKNIFIVFVYPKNLLGLLLVIFWRYPVSTIKLYYNGFIYGFKRSTGKFTKEALCAEEINSGQYFFKNTKLNDNSKLDKLINTKWSLRTNCLTVFEPIIGKLRGYI